MVMCFAPTCKHYSQSHSCKFFAFPHVDAKERKKWIKLIRREDREPTKYSRVCSCHFVGGDRRNGPTIFNYNIGKQFKTPINLRKKLDFSAVASESQPGPSGLHQQFVPEAGPSRLPELESVAGPSVQHFEQSEQVPLEEPIETSGDILPCSAMLSAENYFMKEEINVLRKEVTSLRTSFSFNSIKDNDHLVSVYTGLPTKEIYLTLFSIFENKDLNYFRGWQVERVPKIDQLFLTLIKLKLNLLNDDIGQRFNISRETVTNIFKTWLFALHEVLFQQLMADIPSREKNKLCMPTSFSSFTNCRLIIDCTEVTTCRPKSMEKQRVTFSSYKHRNTLKGLVGVAPNGVVTYASKLYPGSVSDKKITEHCGVLQKLVPGDLILADKGFLISDILPQGVALNVPPFLSTPQFSTEQVLRTRTIAKARIHIERAINRIKLYSILSMIPATLIPHSSIVFQVCAALTNLHLPLIKEVENLYEY